MRSLSTEQIILLLVLVGIPLLRTFWRWMKQVRRLAAPSARPSEPEPLDASLAAPPPRQPGRPRALTRPTKPGHLPAAPAADIPLPRAVPGPTPKPRAHARPARADAVTVPRGSMSLRQVFVWKAILDPPPALPADSDRR